MQNNHFAFFLKKTMRVNPWQTEQISQLAAVLFIFTITIDLFRFARARGPQARESSLSSRVPRAAYTSLVCGGRDEYTHCPRFRRARSTHSRSHQRVHTHASCWRDHSPKSSILMSPLRFHTTSEAYASTGDLQQTSAAARLPFGCERATVRTSSALEH